MLNVHKYVFNENTVSFYSLWLLGESSLLNYLFFLMCFYEKMKEHSIKGENTNCYHWKIYFYPSQHLDIASEKAQNILLPNDSYDKTITQLWVKEKLWAEKRKLFTILLLFLFNILCVILLINANRVLIHQMNDRY